MYKGVGFHTFSPYDHMQFYTLN